MPLPAPNKRVVAQNYCVVDFALRAASSTPRTTPFLPTCTGLRKRGFVTAIDRSDKERGSIYRVERDLTAEDSAAAHSGVAQANFAPLSKKMRREAKPKARRAA